MHTSNIIKKKIDIILPEMSTVSLSTLCWLQAGLSWCEVIVHLWHSQKVVSALRALVKYTVKSHPLARFSLLFPLTVMKS